jgi:hypothetical protein
VTRQSPTFGTGQVEGRRLHAHEMAAALVPPHLASRGIAAADVPASVCAVASSGGAFHVR